MGLERYYKFCPHGCGKSVKYLAGANNYNKFGFYECERCHAVWPDRVTLYQVQVSEGLRSRLPYNVKKKSEVLSS